MFSCSFPLRKGRGCIGARLLFTLSIPHPGHVGVSPGSYSINPRLNRALRHKLSAMVSEMRGVLVDLFCLSLTFCDFPHTCQILSVCGVAATDDDPAHSAMPLGTSHAKMFATMLQLWCFKSTSVPGLDVFRYNSAATSQLQSTQIRVSHLDGFGVFSNFGSFTEPALQQNFSSHSGVGPRCSPRTTCPLHFFTPR